MMSSSSSNSSSKKNGKAERASNQAGASSSNSSSNNKEKADKKGKATSCVPVKRVPGALMAKLKSEKFRYAPSGAALAAREAVDVEQKRRSIGFVKSFAKFAICHEKTPADYRVPRVSQPIGSWRGVGFHADSATPPKVTKQLRACDRCLNIISFPMAAHYMTCGETLNKTGRLALKCCVHVAHRFMEDYAKQAKERKVTRFDEDGTALVTSQGQLAFPHMVRMDVPVNYLPETWDKFLAKYPSKCSCASSCVCDDNWKSAFNAVELSRMENDYEDTCKLHVELQRRVERLKDTDPEIPSAIGHLIGDYVALNFEPEDRAVDTGVQKRVCMGCREIMTLRNASWFLMCEQYLMPTETVNNCHRVRDCCFHLARRFMDDFRDEFPNGAEEGQADKSDVEDMNDTHGYAEGGSKEDKEFVSTDDRTVTVQKANAEWAVGASTRKRRRPTSAKAKSVSIATCRLKPWAPDDIADMEGARKSDPVDIDTDLVQKRYVDGLPDYHVDDETGHMVCNACGATVPDVDYDTHPKSKEHRAELADVTAHERAVVKGKQQGGPSSHRVKLARLDSALSSIVRLRAKRCKVALKVPASVNDKPVIAAAVAAAVSKAVAEPLAGSVLSTVGARTSAPLPTPIPVTVGTRTSAPLPTPIPITTPRRALARISVKQHYAERVTMPAAAPSVATVPLNSAMRGWSEVMD